MERIFQETGKITLAFSYPSAGWVLMAILLTTYNQHLVVHCSDVFEPFTDLLNWLHQLADENLPATFDIDEEGRFKRFVVEQCDEEKEIVEFRVENPGWNEEEQCSESEVLIKCKLNRSQILHEFTSRLQQWLDNDYDPLKFGYDSKEEYRKGYGFDLRECLDLEKLHNKFTF